jgi:hypothetical protein
MVAAGPGRARPLSTGEHRRNRSHERYLMDPKKLSKLSGDEIFGDVTATGGIAVAVVVAEFALQMPA